MNEVKEANGALGEDGYQQAEEDDEPEVGAPAGGEKSAKCPLEEQDQADEQKGATA